MSLEGLEPAAAKLVLKHVNFVTCFECCKIYIAPETAACGHTLCHLCWKGQRTCPSCGESVNKELLALNMVMSTITQHVRDLVEPFQIMTDIKLEEFDVQKLNKKSESSIPKHVKEWLSSSQNHFSLPPNSETQKSLPDEVSPIQLSSSKIQIHAEPTRVSNPPRATHANEMKQKEIKKNFADPQADWDVIKPASDTEDMDCHKDKQNIVGPMDLEPFYIDYDAEYTTKNPRRSSRKRDSINSSNKKASTGNNGSNASENDKKLDKAKQNWTNVKKMKKEFGKLTKTNRSKLNVSIEMCKRTISDKKSNLQTVEKLKDASNLPSAQTYLIEENTPEIEVQNKTKDVNKNAKLVQNENIGNTNKLVDKYNAVRNSKQEFIENGAITKAFKNKNSVNNPITLPINKINSKEIVNLSCAKKSTDHKNKNHSPNVSQGSKNMNLKNDTVKLPIDENNSKEDVHLPSAEKSSDNRNESHSPNVPFLKKSNLQTEKDESHTTLVKNNDATENVDYTNNNDEDIHITIRIGTVVTNITINKKRDVKLKVNSDREVQASLGRHIIAENNATTCQRTETDECEVNPEHEVVTAVSNKAPTQNKKIKDSEKSVSTKKHTASAETVTAQYEISESVEKELSNVMECEEITEKSPKAVSNSKPAAINKPDSSTDKANTNALDRATEDNNVIETEIGFLDEVDIFNSGSVKEINVKSLKQAKGTPSEIFVPTNKSRIKTQREKRRREVIQDEDYRSKKQKHETQEMIDNSEVIPETDPNKLVDMNSEAISYDAVMSQVFANIDADIRDTQSSKNVITLHKEVSAKTKQISQAINKNAESREKITKSIAEIHQKYSENMFSTIGQIDQEHHVAGPETQKNIDNLLTPGMCRDLGATHEMRLDDIVHIGTPKQNIDDSDHSIVEETPQKDKTKAPSKTDSGNKTAISTNKKLQLKTKITNTKEKSKDADEIINLTDSVTIDKGDESNETVKPRNNLETPLTINRFLDDIKHKSTPVARKSLDFARNKANDEDDDDITICPTANIIANTTQERAIMSEAFASVNSPSRRPLSAMNTITQPPVKKFCIAGSCLSNSETDNVKILCYKRKWKFVDKYIPELTHLVVGVDEENKAQRSVKYMCALASSKWIVSFGWVARCLETNKILNEEPFEALDSTGEPGPMNSRLATLKIFKGIKFYCMPPFSVLDVDTLKTMLEAAGGVVVNDLSAVRARPDYPSLVLAEPANTEEDRFMYLTMQSSVVPINYEWILNCLGCYTLCSFYDLLLCPASLLPDATKRWPHELLSIDDSC